MVVAFDAVAVPLSAAIGMAALNERVIEFFKNLLELRLVARGVRALPAWDGGASIDELSARTENTAAADSAEDAAEPVAAKLKECRETLQQLERAAEGSQPVPADLQQQLAVAKAACAPLEAELERLTQGREYGEAPPPSVVLVVDATDPDDGTTARTFILQSLAIVLGIVLAHVSGLQLFNVLLGQQPGGPGALPSALDYLLTGTFIGGGSTQVHVLLDFISARKVPLELASAAASADVVPEPVAVALEAPAVIVPPSAEVASDWKDIPYDGGVDRELLQGVHRRRAKVNLIVYHHTAMALDSSFEDVVRVIKNRSDNGKKWLTGYHCVITGDGVAHPFCRWDRYGNHVAGHNRQSLGISFNGNFETDPKVPFSNATGRYGPPRPTGDQLDMGARVVALWTYLYDLDLDFDRVIVPHRALATKSCPGSVFPTDEFKQLVEHYRNSWRLSSHAQERIATYRLRPYLYDRSVS
jgi:hypothetical protein